jgi:hypothetical protein
MTYLLSLLTDDLSLEKGFDSLCYYINDTKFTQNIEMIFEHKCVFEKLIFSRERILFEAPITAYIKISSFLLTDIKTSEVGCKWFRIAKNCNSESTSR